MGKQKIAGCLKPTLIQRLVTQQMAGYTAYSGKMTRLSDFVRLFPAISSKSGRMIDRETHSH
ncbi:hypothetical protein T06_15536 [Trichinella sp. T6]|uniref:Uncharacterized protein n=1 Tax=Trichinella murrelli TaxID=144512 RepID=A0A0V0TLA1_9BILA|nr:hypothetical protein T05_10181 [Trichinella murrelli]KRX64166.1 hypothetical protein T09_6863 [Trichinella sp. T9]KRX79114.1 hypothetical protein T06_15536 [Trichinella sp. T6]KRZ95604.1 hypothetical protein T08_3229 [Trichinella sp. T8]